MPGRRHARSAFRLLSSLAVGAGLLTVLPVPAGAVAGTDSPVFINELHYDNVGTDVDEFIEVAGPAGTDLTGWTLVLYNGSGGAPYGTTTALSGQLTDSADGYGFTTATYPANGIQNGAPDGVALVDPAGAVIQFLSYEGVMNAVGGPADGQASTDIGVAEAGTETAGLSLQLTGTGSAAGDFTWAAPAAATPGAANNGQAFGAGGPPPPPPPPPVLSKIHDVQGSGPAVALTGTVSVQGIVTSVFTNADVTDGYFVQEEDADADTDPTTSEAIFVFCRGACPSAVAPGDLVDVTGTANDFFGMSQISTNVSGSITVVSSGNPLPAPVPVNLPAPGPTNAEATFEAQEGMIVTIPGALVVSEYFELARYGQIVLTADDRPDQFTHTSAPSAAGYAAFLNDLSTRRIILDDDNNNQNDPVTAPAADEPYPYPVGGLSTTNYFRGGDTVTDLTGVLHWSFAGQTNTDAWRIRQVPGQSYAFTPANPRSANPPAVGGSLKVASFNVLNYFTTLEVPGALCGPAPASLECRGANTAEELTRQRDKIVAAMTAINADIFGLSEIQNDDGASAADLVVGLNAATAPGTYAYLDTGTIGGDAIKVAFVYKPATVTPAGDFAVMDSTVDPTFIDTKNRPALIQTFAENATGAKVTIALNHLKSKGSACDDVGDPDLADGQANCSQTRRAAAVALANYLATDPTGSGDSDVLIMGDLNSYAKEDPITALEAAGYTNMVAAFGGDAAYSYLFDGQLGYLDHALANPSLAPQVTGVAEWHINADENPLFDYNDEFQTTGESAFERESNALPLYAPNPFRSSDHDPVVIGLDLAGAAPVLSCGGVSGTQAELEALGYNVIIGTDRADAIRGTTGNDFILGMDRPDVILGREGDDVICGGGGADVLSGQAGSDQIWGGDGADLVAGGTGDDQLFGEAQPDILLGNGGNDSCDGGSERDLASSCETLIDIP